MTSAFHHFISNLIRLLFSKQCAVCQKTAFLSFCQPCLKQLADESQIKSETLNNSTIFYLYSYHPKIKTLIAKIKYGLEPELLILFLDYLKNQLQKIDQTLNYPLYIPVPLHIQKLLKRKFNQADLIAKAFHPSRTYPIIKRVKETKALHGLTKKERGLEIQKAFEKNGLLKSKRICLVDDIFTTGSTLTEISKLFPDTKIHYFCLAKTPLRL